MATHSDKLLAWFDIHGRKHLPWQLNKTPYRVWISEIMLQQTQVNTVIPYYERFMSSFPDIESLAKAPEDEVLKHWSGLGYYARARNLHKTAKLICDEFKGIFPNKIEQIVELPGIGRSTAGAILSLALNQHHVILDGNVKRVLSRLHKVEGWAGQSKTLNQLWALAEKHTPKKRVADYNQAIMDLGATLCVRGKNAKCSECPFKKTCLANKDQQVANYPVSKPKKSIPVKETYMVMLYNKEHALYVEKRPPVGIWGGLWSFPQHESLDSVNDWCKNKLNVKVKQQNEWQPMRHTFSHFHLDITPVLIEASNPKNIVMEENQAVWYKIGVHHDRGYAAPMMKLFKKLEVELGV